MFDDFERCVRAVQSKDARFDGWFVTAVLSTGIYCRPSCPVRPPKVQNMRFYPTAAAAQQAGFRACKRCAPDASPGSPEWCSRADLVARAVRLISDGVVDREGVAGLARRLGYSERQIERHLVAELGAGPLALARAQRAQAARVLIETTTLRFSQVAFAAGFSSIRQFNDTVRVVFDRTPTELRRHATRHPRPNGVAPGTIRLRLPFRRPLDLSHVFGYLAATAVPGVEEMDGSTYRRVLRLPNGTAVVALTELADHIACTLRLDDLRDLQTAIARCRRLLDLDADPEAVDEQLRADRLLAPLVRAAPGRRIPRTVDGAEYALRAVLGQQVSTAAARTHAARLAAALGEPVDDPAGGLHTAFPSAEAIAGVDPRQLRLPEPRRRTVITLATALADGTVDVDAGADWARARQDLLAIPGIGDWTSEMVAMRALGDPDAFPAGDLGVRQAAAELGIGTSRRELFEVGARWQPWRAYAVQHLWATRPHVTNQPKEAVA